MERDGHKLAFRVIDRRDEVDQALDRFFELHTARSQAQDMSFHRDNFQVKKHREFLVDVFKTFALGGHVRILEMDVNGELAAIRLAFAFDDELYVYFSGFDPKWKQYGVMTTLIVETIKWAIENGFKTLNLSTGKDLSKLRWKPTEITFQDITQSANSPRGQLTLRMDQWLRNRGRKAVPAEAQ
jgi:CelD/BcsL family acetyltransferase involved in cellulose biosynthesis